MDLMNFQIDAMAELNDAMNKGGRDIVLKSPTGSGKTIILTTFMQDYMKANPNIVFVWLTPGKGELQEQSRAKMDIYCHGASTKNLADVMTGGFAAGDAVFVNWQKLTMKGNVALKDSERTNFLEWIQKAFDAGINFKVVIDESHENFTDKADEVISYFKTDKIIWASATPRENPKAIWVEVTEEEVIAEGLIKKIIQINPDFPKGKTFKDKDEVEFLLEQAFAKLQDVKAAFVAKGSAVNPLIVVQMPNNSDAQLAEVVSWFDKNGINVDTGTLAIWLADRKENLENISDNTAKQRVVIIKQAIATGWDCPRAHILVKLRKNMDETFEIQTLGRIRRMPEACHYENDVLDSCYLYTLDEKFTSEARQKLAGRALNAMKLFLKKEYRGFTLTTEQRTMVTDTRDPVLALTSAYSYFVKKYKLDGNENKNKTRLESAGYNFSTDIVNKTLTGDAAVLDDVFKGNGMKQVGFNTVLDTHKHGQYFRHALGEVGAGCGMPYNDVRGIVSRLFGEKPERVKKFIKLSPKALYAFAINNMHALKDDFRNAMSADLPSAVKANPVSEKEFHIPREWIFTYDASLSSQKECVKNVYKGYLASGQPRSSGEKKFEKWCEKTSAVDWFYRNGDKGDEFFSIVYQDNSGKQKLFYPDYVLSIKGNIWIVEVKGGFNSSGASENIDLYAEKKSIALKAYCSKHGILGGFVCYSEDEGELLISTGKFSENEKDSCWQILDDVTERITDGAHDDAPDENDYEDRLAAFEPKDGDTH